MSAPQLPSDNASSSQLEYVNVAVLTFQFCRSIPVSFVGLISNIDALIKLAPFLSFINSIPTSILGVVTSLLPAVLLAVLMALLPIWLRFLAKFAGVPTLSQVELRLQKSYFWFQVRSSALYSEHCAKQSTRSFMSSS
jgi:branched-subunit amino acid transport protein AzlD